MHLSGQGALVVSEAGAGRAAVPKKIIPSLTGQHFTPDQHPTFLVYKPQMTASSIGSGITNIGLGEATDEAIQFAAAVPYPRSHLEVVQFLHRSGAVVHPPYQRNHLDVIAYLNLIGADREAERNHLEAPADPTQQVPADDPAPDSSWLRFN